MKFEVPQRQQLASERTSLTLFAPAPSTTSFIPLTRNFSPAAPSPYPVRGWTGLSEATATRFKVSIDCSTCPCSNRQTGQRVSVREIRYRKQPPTVRNTHSVLKKASWGTRRIFKGPQNSRLHRLWTAYCRTGRGFNARNSPRSEVIRLKRGCIPWKCLRILLRNLTGFSKNYCPAASRHNAGMTFSI